MADEKGPKLKEIYDELWKTYIYLDSCEEPIVSENVQKRVKKGIEDGERAIHMVNEIHLFSDNEEIEEVATNELRYMLLPALLAYFTGKITKDERFEVVKRTQDYYIHFLKLVKLYGLTQLEIPKGYREKQEEEEDGAKNTVAKNNVPSRPDLQAMNRQREDKIKRYKEQKETEQKLKDLHEAVNREHVDEEVQRNYYITLIKKWIHTAREELESIEMEIPILEMMAKRKNGQATGEEPASRKEEKRKPFQPFILTRDKLQQQVYGAGYPSLPTLTVTEWYEQSVREGRFPDHSHQSSGGSLQGRATDPETVAREEEADDIQKEENIEKDDEETLKQAREWDDWKDDHRRGWGNRQNMG